MRTDTIRIPIIDGQVDTTSEIPAPWLRPAVIRTYATPRARLARRLAMLRRSPFAADLRGARRAAFWPLAVGCGLLIAAVVIASRGHYVTWHGIESIPVGGAQ